MTKTESAIERHNRMVREERDQAERVRTDRASQDIWRPNARRFRPADESVDPAVAVLAKLAGAVARVIDVGAGGGRIALPLSRLVREVVAVEPSPAMREVLEAEIVRTSVDNISIVPERWDDAEIGSAELVFAAHVTYGVMDIEPFLRKLDRAANRHAALVAFRDPPQHFVAPFWREVYGEARLRLPGHAELVEVLGELSAEPRVAELPPQELRSFGSRDEAFDQLRRRLFIGEGNPLEDRLREAIAALTIERDGEILLAEPQANPMVVIWWEPAGM